MYLRQLVNDFMFQIFGFLCTQDPAHTWAPGGDLLPVCQRCTGLYVGAAFALVLLLRFRPLTDARYRWLHAIFLLIMTPFGFHLVPHGAVLRTTSGYWFGFGVVGLLWLLPEARISDGTGRMASSLKPYLLMGAAGTLLLPFIAIWGGAIASLTLSWLAVAGMAAIAGLLAGNVALFGSSILAWLRRSAMSAIS